MKETIIINHITNYFYDLYNEIDESIIDNKTRRQVTNVIAVIHNHILRIILGEKITFKDFRFLNGEIEEFDDIFWEELHEILSS